MEKKNVIIIGGGISGLTAGIYALDNGYNVTIYEKHSIPGGQCTGWNRDGVYIDGCAHFIVGTNPKSDLYPLWRHIGAFDESSVIHDTDYFAKYDINGQVVTFYADLEDLENEFYRVAPEDRKHIRNFINGIKNYQSVRIPVTKPTDQMNIFELIGYGIPMLKMVPNLLKYMHVSNKEYASKFKSPILKEVFHRIIDDNYNIHSLFYIMQALSTSNAGVVEGGSRHLALNVANTFKAKGGKLVCNAPINHVIIQDNKAIGVLLEDGKEVYGDYIISSADANFTLNKLLEGKYEDKYFASKFNNKKDYPLVTGIQLSYKVTANVNNYPKMINFSIPKIWLSSDTMIDNITVRNHSFDSKLNKDATTLTVLIDTNEGVYEYLKKLNKDKYNQAKEKLGNEIMLYIKDYFKLEDDEIKLVDVTTPLTYERYTNAYKGSYMSFLTTKKVKGLMRPGLIKGLDNFILTGQWLMPPGGLPIALFTGKHAAYRITKMDKKSFIDLDRQFVLTRKRVRVHN